MESMPMEDTIGPDPRPVASPNLTELLGRALLDQQLCDLLFADPDAVGRAFDLSAAEIDAIKRLDRQKFDAAITRLRWG